MISPRPDWSDKREPWHLAEDFDDLSSEIGPELPFWKPVIIATLIILFLYGMLGWVLFWPTAAKAHEAPSGWTYDIGCCSNRDCREMPERAVIEGPDGYLVPSGDVISYSDYRVRKSPDGLFHWCTDKGADDTRTICLYVPPRAF